MANTFLNATASLTDSDEATVGTVPSGRTWVILGCNIANTNSSQIEVDIKAASKYVVKTTPIPAGSALSVIDGKIVLTAGQTVTAQSSNDLGYTDIILSYMEQS